MSNKCPRCPGELEIIDIDGIKIDVCGSCRGIFLDRYELNRLKALDNGNEKLKAAGGGAEIKPDTGHKINCIRCQSPMQTINFSYSSGIFIDHCPACDSVWLDNGELEKILEFLKAGEEITEQETSEYSEILNNIKNQAEERRQKDFRAISSEGRMGSIVNYVYKMINKFGN